jgi:hypothetical protein
MMQLTVKRDTQLASVEDVAVPKEGTNGHAVGRPVGGKCAEATAFP